MTAPGRCPLHLVPSCERGWFSGRGLSASDPLDVREEVSLSEAAATLEDVFAGRDAAATLAVALVAYDGTATVLRYAHASLPSAPATAPRAPLVTGARASATPRDFRAQVRSVREAIAAGDVYVLNLTYQLLGRTVASAEETFAGLLSSAGSEMSAYLETPSLTIASVSPERFVRVRESVDGRIAEVWPIKGTRPRGADAATDAALAAQLAASTKERAEHVMVVDMERNDLGRVCVPGSVIAEPLFEVVPTPYCHQMVSRVHGVVLPEATFADVLEATFPCGSITGAPKTAAIRISGELEREARGVYTGALVVARRGELDSSVLIRTAVFSDGDTLSWGTGGGITIDSDPAEEYLETLLKASPLTGDGSPAVALRETCRVSGGRAPLLAYHLSRLAAGGCGPTQLAHVRRAVADACAAPEGARGTRLAVTALPDGTVTAELSDRPSSLDVPGGPALVTVPVATLPQLPTGAAKPAERSVWDAAQAVAGPGAQAVLVGPDGYVIDGATATVWVRRGSTLLTPPAPPAVSGVAREVVFDHAAACGYAASEASLTASDLDGADEVFFTNAYAGAVAARDRGGEASERLAAVFRRIFDGESPG